MEAKKEKKIQKEKRNQTWKNTVKPEAAIALREHRVICFRGGSKAQSGVTQAVTYELQSKALSTCCSLGIKVKCGMATA